MRIPTSHRKKALIIVDVQPLFLNKKNKAVLFSIERLLTSIPYDLYFECVFFAPKKSIWDKQTNWVSSKKQAFTVSKILKLLQNKKYFHIQKITKSAFKGKPGISKLLKENKIKEAHIVGLDTNDCILATAFESFDLGFFTYVIEECVQSSSGNELNKSAVSLLRHLNLTNNSSVEKTPSKIIS